MKKKIRKVSIKKNNKIKELKLTNPKYYTKGIEITKFAQSHGLSFAEGNIVKYIVRHKYKNGIEDLKKAEKYLQLLKEQYENK